MNLEKEKIKLIKEVLWLRGKINFDFLFDQNKFSHNDIKRYYKKTKYLLYRLAGSKLGYMHIGISDDGIYKKRKNYQDYQVKKIDEIIKENNCKSIVELGCGQGANMAYLAKKNPDSKFTGMDLYPSLDKRHRKLNINLIDGDYHNLSKIENDSVDLVYAIETLCYSMNKNQIFKEVNRILKKDGLFVIFDAYLNKERNKLSEIENIGASLVETGYYLDEFEYIGNISNYINNNEFKIIKAEDMKPKVINHLYGYKHRIQKYFKLGPLFWLFCKIIPKEVLGNIVPVYFMADTVEMNLSVYYYHILKK